MTTTEWTLILDDGSEHTDSMGGMQLDWLEMMSSRQIVLRWWDGNLAPITYNDNKTHEPLDYELLFDKVSMTARMVVL